MTITRRRALVLSLAFLGLVSSRLSMSKLLNDYSENWISVLATGVDRTAVGQLASIYLKKYPEEKGDPDLLISSILNRYDDKESVGVFLRKIVRRDFVNNEVAKLSGWRLSRTEGRILILIALLTE